MAAFATASELASHLQVPSVDTASATLALNVASKAVRTHCGWEITEETVTDKVLDAHGGRSIWLPTLLLTAVASVEENGATLTVVTDYDWTSYGKLIRNGCWSNQARAVTVTYTHGYAVVPDDIKGVCLAAAGRRFQNPEARRSYTVGAVSESFAVPATGSVGLFYEAELAELEPYALVPFP